MLLFFTNCDNEWDKPAKIGFDFVAKQVEQEKQVNNTITDYGSKNPSANYDSISNSNDTKYNDNSNFYLPEGRPGNPNDSITKDSIIIESPQDLKKFSKGIIKFSKASLSINEFHLHGVRKNGEDININSKKNKLIKFSDTITTFPAYDYEIPKGTYSNMDMNINIENIQLVYKLLFISNQESQREWKIDVKLQVNKPISITVNSNKNNNQIIFQDGDSKKIGIELETLRFLPDLTLKEWAFANKSISNHNISVIINHNYNNNIYQLIQDQKSKVFSASVK